MRQKSLINGAMAATGAESALRAARAVKPPISSILRSTLKLLGENGFPDLTIEIRCGPCRGGQGNGLSLVAE